MLDSVLSLIEKYDMAPPDETVLCAVSGGADSMCLLHFMCALGNQRGFSVAAAHYNHRLRGAESERDAAFVAGWCRERGIPCLTGSGDVAAQAAAQGTGIEETARRMRYAFLAQAAETLGAARIATAHNADDNVETLLFHLTRGSALQGLTGIRPRRDTIIRPLLAVPRKEIEAYLTLHNVPHVEDSTNADTAYTRNLLRHEVVPVLRRLNPRLTESVTSTLEALRSDNDFLNARAAERAAKADWAEDNLVIDTKVLAWAPAAIAPRVVRLLLERMGDGRVQAGSVHLRAVADLARGDDPSAQLHLPGGILVQRVYSEMLFTTSREPLPPLDPVPLNTEGETEIPGTFWRALCRTVTFRDDSHKNRDTFYLKCDMIVGAVCLRPRMKGDAITLPGRGTKTLKKLMIEAKVPRRLREQVPVLADKSGPLAVAGFGGSARHLPAPGDRALEITFISEKG